MVCRTYDPVRGRGESGGRGADGKRGVFGGKKPRDGKESDGEEEAERTRSALSGAPLGRDCDAVENSLEEEEHRRGDDSRRLVADRSRASQDRHAGALADGGEEHELALGLSATYMAEGRRSMKCVTGNAG
jgi:hypothetical protein